ARHPGKVSALSLIGTAATMSVGPDLLKAAEANSQDANDMVSIWGLGFNAELGGSLAPGLWMHGGAQAVLKSCEPGVLFRDLSACNAYTNALAAAASVKVPATLILGERDMMTPANRPARRPVNSSRTRSTRSGKASMARVRHARPSPSACPRRAAPASTCRRHARGRPINRRVAAQNTPMRSVRANVPRSAAHAC